LLLSSFLCLSIPAFSQTAAKPKAVGAIDEHPDTVELDPFGGVSMFGSIDRGLGQKFAQGGTYGGRVTWNASRWVGLELFYDYSYNNVSFRTSSGVYPPGSTAALPGTPLPTYSFSNRVHSFAFNPIFNLRPRGSKVQPYLTAGFGAADFVPTNAAQGLARSPEQAPFMVQNLTDNLQPEINYGGGIKWHFTDHFGLRLDARGFLLYNPTFGLPNYPNGGVYIPRHSHLNGFQATAGLVWYLGSAGPCPVPTPLPPPPPLNQGAITGGDAGPICQGKPVNLHSTASGPDGHKLKYAWTLNGQPSGSDSPDFSFTPNNTGDFQVAVTVSDATPPPAPEAPPAKLPKRCLPWTPPTYVPPAPVTATTTLTVADAAPQITSVTSSASTLSCAADTTGTHTATLSASATAGACGGNLSYKWTVSEGSVTNDTSANATFDASSLTFEGGATNQTKTITATVTVTTDTGKTATQTTQITVNCPPQFVRLSDVVFAKNKSRVNNCGKRILIDEAAPRVANGDYDIILVGHRDSDEAENEPAARRGKRSKAPQNTLDEQRALNAAAVLSGGTGTCAKVDPSRIKIDWVGTDQTSDAQPGLCGTSNQPAAQKERKGAAVTDADKNRRVEVYLVPHSSTSMPPAVKNARPLPADEMKLLGCPK
jgi:outer membrane protein OmpA-like peptidoglycan-associated protein